MSLNKSELLMHINDEEIALKKDQRTNFDGIPQLKKRRQKL